ncbi:MAG: 3-dehydroquinate synthase [Terriglobales bacterium]
MPKITVSLATPYTAVVERGALAHAAQLVRKYLPEGGKAVVVTTPTVRRLWGAAVEASLAASGLPATVLEMPDGERHKTLGTLASLAEGMVRAGADRDALVVALGGGVVGDVAAFLASVYMRGVALIQIPTTLVAMLDSALGGKTAVNLEAGKNLIGTFHHPRAILADPTVLRTLPEREYRSGMAEAIKYGIIADRGLFEFVESERAALGQRDPVQLERLIAACLEHKSAVVAADEREGDLRRTLNFGHTLGHALESATGYQSFLHGEAVAWGMIAAGQIAVRLHRFDAADARRMSEAILAVAGPLPPITADPDLVLRHTASDKKARGGAIHYVLPTAIGKVEIVRGVPAAVVRAALTATQAWSQQSS